VEHWIQHGDLSTVARRVKARYVDKWKKHDRKEAEPPWMVTMTLSDASPPHPMDIWVKGWERRH
jgi:hypothetical protein